MSKKNQILTKQAILSAKDLKKELIEVPEWGGSIYVRSLTGEERDKFEEEVFKASKNKKNSSLTNMRARMTVLCAVDEDGTRLFEDADIPTLGKKSGAALNRVFAAAQKINGWTEEEVNELAKNSESE